jgi:hypothetical protein
MHVLLKSRWLLAPCIALGVAPLWQPASAHAETIIASNSTSFGGGLHAMNDAGYVRVGSSLITGTSGGGRERRHRTCSTQ